MAQISPSHTQWKAICIIILSLIKAIQRYYTLRGHYFPSSGINLTKWNCVQKHIVSLLLLLTVHYIVNKTNTAILRYYITMLYTRISGTQFPPLSGINLTKGECVLETHNISVLLLFTIKLFTLLLSNLHGEICAKQMSPDKSFLQFYF